MSGDTNTAVTILLVEDDPPLRSLVARMLHRSTASSSARSSFAFHKSSATWRSASRFCSCAMSLTQGRRNHNHDKRATLL